MQKLLQSFLRLFHSHQVGCCFYFSLAAAAVGDGTTISFENRKYGRRGLDPQKVIYNFHFIMCKHEETLQLCVLYTQQLPAKTKNYSTSRGIVLTNFDLCSAAILDILLMLVVVLADKVVFHVLSFDIQMIPFSLGDGSYLQISLWLMFVFQWALIFLLYRTCNLCLFIFEDINQFNYLSSQSSPMVSL